MMQRCVVLVLIVGTFLAVCAGHCLAASGQMLFAGCSPTNGACPGLFVVDTDGGDPVRLLAADTAGEWNCLQQPDWSPDGSMVVLAYSRDGGVCQIVVVGGCCTLPPNSDGPAAGREPETIWSCGMSPKWSPTGDRIAFITAGSIAVINPDGTGYRELAPVPAIVWGTLSWAPDGASIVVGSRWRCHGDLHLVTDLDNPGGATVTQMTDTPSLAEESPAISPDGMYLAYSVGPDMGPDWEWQDFAVAAGVCTADYPALTNARVLTNDASYHDAVVGWLPDGEYVYFVRSVVGEHPSARPPCLWRVKADGSEPPEQAPGLSAWPLGVASISFLKRGVYTTSSYTLPGYTDVPVSLGVVGVENLAGVQSKIQFNPCSGTCPPIVDSLDSLSLGDMIPSWSLFGPVVDEEAGTVASLALAPNPDLDKVSGSGELLGLTMSIKPYEEVSGPEAVTPVWCSQLELSDDWGEPMDLPHIQGGLTLKPFSYLELSPMPSQVWADQTDPVPFTLTLTARGDNDEPLTSLSKLVELLVEMPDPESDYPRPYGDIISPNVVALTNGTWTGDVSILGPVRSPARILTRHADWGGRSNDFSAQIKGDISGDGEIDIFDVVKLANIVIDRGTWTDAQRWAADLTGPDGVPDGVVDVLDVTLCGDLALGAMSALGAPAHMGAATDGGKGRAAGARAPKPSVATISTSVSTTKTQQIVSVKLSDCAGLAGIQLDLQYDASLLSFASMAKGPLLTGTTSWSLASNDKGGLVKAIAYTPSRETLARGSGTILTFTFNRKSTKKTGAVSLSAAKLSGAGGVLVASRIK